MFVADHIIKEMDWKKFTLRSSEVEAFDNAKFLGERVGVLEQRSADG